MPLITPPPNDEPPKESPRVEKELFELHRELSKDFFDGEPWVCPKCKLTNHKWNKACADWRCKTPKPS